MLTPYDWQEGIGNRAQYIEAKLEAGAPIIGISHADGILLVTYKRQNRKLFEVYDRLAYAGIGQQSDVEAIRIAAVDFASREGYQRSEQDVTIQRITAAVSTPIKRAFGDFSSAPFVIRCVFAEVNESPAEDRFYTVDFTGDYSTSTGFVAVSGEESVQTALETKLKSLDLSRPIEDLLTEVYDLWQSAVTPEDAVREEFMTGLKPEALLIERSDARVDRFKLLTPIE